MVGSVNKVILLGNLGRDPEIRSMQSGKKMAGMKKKLGKGTTAKAKSGSMKMRADKKAKKSKAMYA